MCSPRGSPTYDLRLIERRAAAPETSLSGTGPLEARRPPWLSQAGTGPVGNGRHKHPTAIWCTMRLQLGHQRVFPSSKYADASRSTNKATEGPVAGPGCRAARQPSGNQGQTLMETRAPLIMTSSAWGLGGLGLGSTSSAGAPGQQIKTQSQKAHAYARSDWERLCRCERRP